MELRQHTTSSRLQEKSMTAKSLQLEESHDDCARRAKDQQSFLAFPPDSLELGRSGKAWRDVGTAGRGWLPRVGAGVV